ncbi:unnamed protein product [Microthlaspi erraticum]|uniref:TIR domain-containing protein n=1 Tax=Microthlaspi erraticum TaxID=1685480 RepID=A0A6D2KGT0_9BRAS|nr:unnamed protein product [Microthlaspi erraticum]
MEQAEKREMVVIPIFYKVKPEDVRKQKGVFGYRFWRRSEESGREEIEKWQVALKAVSNKIGFTLDHNRSEAKLIKKVVKEVGKVSTTIQSKTYNVPLALPLAWFGSAVWLIGAVLGLLADTVHKCASPIMVVLASQVGSVVAISNRWTDMSV